MKLISIIALSLALLIPVVILVVDPGKDPEVEAEADSVMVLEKDQAVYLRFFPLGELPPWEEELVDGMRVPKLPPSGSIPPSPVGMVSGDEVILFKFQMRTMTSVKMMKIGTPALLLKRGETPESPDWLQMPAPDASLNLGVLLADPTNMGWEKPRMVLLNDDAESFPAGKIRFVNVSDKVVIVHLGGPKSRPFGIAPGKTSIKPVKQGPSLLKVGYRTGAGGPEVIYQNSISVSADQRVQCFFYKTGPVKRKREVEICYLAEKIPRLPGPVPKKK